MAGLLCRSVRRLGGSSGVIRIAGAGSSSSSYSGRFRTISRMAEGVRCSAPSSEPASSSPKRTMETYLETVTTAASATRPETAPPAFRARPAVQSSFKTPALLRAWSPAANSVWKSAPARTGSSRAQVVRRATGRPRCSSRIPPASSMAGPASQ